MTRPPARHLDRLPNDRQLLHFFVLSWLLVAIHLGSFAVAAQMTDMATASWTLATTASYAFLYLLPALVIGVVLRLALPPGSGRVGGAWLVAIALIFLTGATHTLLFADRMIYDMYGFHINGFVLDLVLTPGGIASLGASRGTEMTALAIILALFAMQAAAYVWSMRQGPRPGVAGSRRPRGGPRVRWLLLAVLVMTLGERVAYGVSHATNYQPILFASERYPFYLPLTFRKLARAAGLGDGGGETVSARVKTIELGYPLAPLTVAKPEKPLNIVWLVAESLRFDMLTPEIMPNLWRLSEQSLRLERHYSGGNMTQMGVFTMFYGLYGNYWFPMLAARRPPVLMDELQRQGYQFGLYTSQRFTYPAFDKTIFTRMNPADMHALSGGPAAWQRDRQNIDALGEFIDRRDPKRPFMTYMFFESTHANYSFPEDSAIARPYLEDLNYLTADFAKDIGPIKNRYVNAAHHVDGQIGRVVEHLRSRDLLDSTVIIVLGDHGEEFMEHSRWGHSSGFNRQQTSTPAVIRVPGQAPRVVTGITSHLDIPATLMPLLGVKNPPRDYSQGGNLLAPDFHRAYAVAADWNRIAYLGADYKITLPINSMGALRNEVTDGEDAPVRDARMAKQAVQPALREIMVNLNRFSRHVH
jgi:membrane-anchored protein YejM (alkaline phosphatase superfamily)